MRPDEHKRKKNAQYKQKHGIKPTKKASSESDSRSKPRDDRRDVRHPKNVGLNSKENVTNEHVNDAIDGASNNLSGVGIEALPRSVVAPTFHKRKLASNWERYAEPDAEEIVTQRGADFQDVLAATGGALAGFRFKEEEDWSIDEDQSGQAAANFLAVDCDRLASALLSVPLHERLNIEASAFEKRDIELFLEQAESNKVALKEKPFETQREVASEDIRHVIGDTSVSDVKLTEDHVDDPAASNVTFDDDVLNDILGNDDCIVSVEDTTKLQEDNSTSITPIKNIDDATNSNTLGAPEEPSTNKPLCTERAVSNETGNKLEKGIDDLLEDLCKDKETQEKSHHIESPRREQLDQNPNTHTTNEPGVSIDPIKTSSDKPETVVNPEGTVNIEDELDFLLSLDSAVTNCDIQKNEVEKTEQNDLDDWLDSMVDD